MVRPHQRDTNIASMAVPPAFFEEAHLATIDIAIAHDHDDAPAMQQAAEGEAARLLAAIRARVPEIAPRSAEIETARRVPDNIVDQLRQLGFYRTLLPRNHR